jgi:hypothetical protein
VPVSEGASSDASGRPIRESEPDQGLSAEDELADRRLRANRATRGGLAAVLCLEAFVVLLVPRTIAQTSIGLSTTSTITLLLFAIALVVTGFLLKRRWGIGLGSVMQVLLALTIILVPLIAIVVIIFVSIWLYLLHTRTQLVGTPTGWRMLIS